MSDREELMRSEVVDERPVIDSTEQDLLALLNENSYQKGGWVLHMLRSMLGDSAFFAGIRSYYHTYEYGNASSDDFEDAMERASGRDLSWFFRQWLRRPGYADFGVKWGYEAGSGELKLVIDQSPSRAPYRFPLTLVAKLGNGKSQRATVEVPALRHTELSVPVREVPLEVVFDPDVELLASIHVFR